MKPHEWLTLSGKALWEQVSTNPIVESIENSPYGAKEEGEGAIMPTIPAILNAVYDAIGISIHELPLTPERRISGHSKEQ